MAHNFKVGDLVRVKNLPVMRRDPEWRTFIGKTGVVKRVDGDVITITPVAPNDNGTYLAYVLEHFGPLDFSQRDEGGVV